MTVYPHESPTLNNILANALRAAFETIYFSKDEEEEEYNLYLEEGPTRIAGVHLGFQDKQDLWMIRFLKTVDEENKFESSDKFEDEFDLVVANDISEVEKYASKKLHERNLIRKNLSIEGTHNAFNQI